MILALLVLTTLFVAYSNGANDNFKGVATLYGSNTTTFNTALWIGTLATLAGCIASVFLAEALVKAFSGKGLVPDAISASPNFLTAVAAGAASTVMLATVLGFPISTTHALTGALVGAGFVAAGSAAQSVAARNVILPAAAAEPADLAADRHAALQARARAGRAARYRAGELRLRRPEPIRAGQGTGVRRRHRPVFCAGHGRRAFASRSGRSTNACRNTTASCWA